MLNLAFNLAPASLSIAAESMQGLGDSREAASNDIVRSLLNPYEFARPNRENVFSPFPHSRLFGVRALSRILHG